MSTPVMLLIISSERCPMLPGPAVPQRNLPGFDLARFRSSRRLLAGKSLRPVITMETEAIVEIGMKYNSETQTFETIDFTN